MGRLAALTPQRRAHASRSDESLCAPAAPVGSPVRPRRRPWGRAPRPTARRAEKRADAAPRPELDSAAVRPL